MLRTLRNLVVCVQFGKLLGRLRFQVITKLRLVVLTVTAKSRSSWKRETEVLV